MYLEELAKAVGFEPILRGGETYWAWRQFEAWPGHLPLPNFRTKLISYWDKNPIPDTLDGVAGCWPKEKASWNVNGLKWNAAIYHGENKWQFVWFLRSENEKQDRALFTAEVLNAIRNNSVRENPQ